MEESGTWVGSSCYAESTFCPGYGTTNTFHNYRKPVMLIFIWKLLQSTIRWVPMCQGFNHYSTSFSNYFVLSKSATSSTMFKKLKPISQIIDKWKQVDMKPVVQPEQASLNLCQLIAPNPCPAHAQLMQVIKLLCNVNGTWALIGPCSHVTSHWCKISDAWVQPFPIVIGLWLHIHSSLHLRSYHIFKATLNLSFSS